EEEMRTVRAPGPTFLESQDLRMRSSRPVETSRRWTVGTPAGPRRLLSTAFRGTATLYGRCHNRVDAGGRTEGEPYLGHGGRAGRGGERPRAVAAGGCGARGHRGGGPGRRRQTGRSAHLPRRRGAHESLRRRPRGKRPRGQSVHATRRRPAG